MLVRQARPEDAPALTALYRELVPTDRNIHVEARRLGEIAADASNHLFVLERDGAVVGTAFLTLCLDAMYGQLPYGVVENLVVSADCRGKGGGRALMIALEAEARAAHCTKLMLLSTVTRVHAHRFFAEIGYDGERKRGFIKYLNRCPPLR